MSNKTQSFDHLDLGTTRPTSVPMETIIVEISADNLLGDYALAFVEECARTQPLRAQQVGLTVQEVRDYSTFLLHARVESAVGHLPQFSRYKMLYIPAFIQYCLSNVGVVVKYDVGLKMVPALSEKVTMTIEEALVISDRIAAFKDTLVIVNDAMPRTRDGNPEVMSAALIAGFVRAQEKISPVSSYVSAFLGFKLREENIFQLLYRIQYDDVKMIQAALTRVGGLF